MQEKTNYEKKGRFSQITKGELLEAFIKKIRGILIIVESNESDYFKLRGKLTSKIWGMKLYSDSRIIALQNLFKKEYFKQLSSREKYHKINNTIIDNKPHFLKSMITNEEDNLNYFLNAIQEQNILELNKIHKQLNKKHKKLDEVVSDFAVPFMRAITGIHPKKKTSNQVRYTKKQALSAANKWLCILENYVPGLLKQIHRLPKATPIVLTEFQKNLFITTLVDAIWYDECNKNQADKKIVKIDYNSHVQAALIQAKIDFKYRETKLDLFVAIYENVEPVEHNLKTHFESLITIDNVKSPEKSCGYVQPQPKLPHDSLIQFRDAISTLEGGAAQHPKTPNYYSMPRRLRAYLLLFASPENLSSEKARKEIDWNNERLKQNKLHFLR